MEQDLENGLLTVQGKNAQATNYASLGSTSTNTYGQSFWKLVLSAFRDPLTRVKACTYKYEPIWLSLLVKGILCGVAALLSFHRNPKRILSASAN